MLVYDSFIVVYCNNFLGIVPKGFHRLPTYLYMDHDTERLKLLHLHNRLKGVVVEGVKVELG